MICTTEISIKIQESYRDLTAWQRGMEIARFVFLMTESFIEDKKTGLKQTLRDSALMIPTRIAQGHSRGSRADFLRVLAQARGALAELDTKSIFAHQIQFLDYEPRHHLEVLIIEMRKLLDQLAARLSETE